MRTVLRPALHEKRAQAFPLGEPDADKFEAEFLSVYPPNDRFLNAERPLVVEKEQRQFETHAGSQGHAGRCPASVRRKVNERGLALKVALAEKEEAERHGNPAASAFFRAVSTLVAGLIAAW